MHGMVLVNVFYLGKFDINGARSLVGVADFEFDVVACVRADKAFHVTDVDEDVVRLILDIDKAEAAMVKPASNRSLHLNLSPQCRVGRKRSAYRTRRGDTRFSSGSKFISFVLHGKNAVCFLRTVVLSGVLLKVRYFLNDKKISTDPQIKFGVIRGAC